jgi:hypothetical protein
MIQLESRTTPRTPPPRPNSQNQALQAAEQLIHRHTEKTDTEDLIDIFRVEVASGVPIKEALNAVLKWDETTHKKPPVERFTPGFAITPAEMMHDQTFMEGFNHTGRLMMVYLQVSNGGTGDIFLSNRTLMDRTFIADEQSVIRAKNRLKKDGRIFETGRTIGRGVKVIRLKTPDKSTPQPLTNRLTQPSQFGLQKRTEKEIQKETTPRPAKPTKPTRMIQNDVVVVSSVDLPLQADNPNTTNQPIHPAITNQDQTIINRLLAKVSKDQSNELIEELKARLDGGGEPIRNPVGFIVALIKSVKGGTWALSAARRRKEEQEAKRLTQERQKAEQKRLKAEEEHQQTEQKKLDNAKSLITTEELLNHKELFINQIKSKSDFNFKRLKAQSFKGVGFDMLFNGYLREELLGT